VSSLVAVEVTRGGHVESTHAADVAVVEVTPAGRRLVAKLGDPARSAFLRSSWKPLQAAACFDCGLEQRFGIAPGSRELAIMSASHGATPAQLNAVQSILETCGLSEAALGCGAHKPASREGMAALGDGQARRIHGNCSGKHAGMLAACVAKGWSTDGYLGLDHPLQRHVRQWFADAMRLPLDQVLGGIDGCGLATWSAPLDASAEAFGRLGLSPSDVTPPTYAAVGSAMAAHPLLVGPPEGINVRLMQAAPHVLCKTGAEAAFAIAVPDRRLGIALKVHDGAQRAVAPLVIRILRQLDVIDEAVVEQLAEFSEPVIDNLDGEPVGVIRAVADLEPVA